MLQRIPDRVSEEEEWTKTESQAGDEGEGERGEKSFEKEGKLTLANLFVSSLILWASGRGDFLLDSWSQHGFWLHSLENFFGWEYRSRSSLCTHAFHRHGLKKPWFSCSRWVNAGNKNTPSMHHPWRWNVTMSMVGYAKILPKMVNPRDSWESRKRRKSAEN